MIRLLLCLAALAPCARAAAQYEVMPPVYRKPETPPPPPTGAGRVPPMLDASRPCAKPDFPAGSPPAEGVVEVQLLVETDGHVSDTRILRSSGYPALDEATRTALALCRYKPGTIDGRPERAWAQLRYRWTRPER